MSSQLEFLLLLACFIGFHPMFITVLLTVSPIIIIVIVCAVAGIPGACGPSVAIGILAGAEDSPVACFIGFAGIPSGSGVLFLKRGG
jgi:hypothetical protein